MNAFYVRAESEALTTVLKKSFPSAQLAAGNGFTSVILEDEAFNPPTEMLAKLSLDFSADVIWLGFQSVVDAFIFHHWQNGSLLRSLVHGCNGPEERTWEVVSGLPEPWEKEVFFDEKDLQFLLKHAKDASQKSDYERMWKNRELIPGRSEPMVDSKAAAWAVARHYQLPGWDSPGEPAAMARPSGSVQAAPPPVPPTVKNFEVRARLVPRYLWTSASIDVYLDGQCILMTGGQMKLTGSYSSSFIDGGNKHLAELKWGTSSDHQFPYELWIDGTKIRESWVPVENPNMSYIPATMILLVIFGILAALYSGCVHLMQRLQR